ncbi:hypothetical protein SAMN05192560_0247 [Methylobacillus rhizosphaerae]|uniref:Uncharacterized protein n=1 Tax=Methylobacillus rhizosphaerae TaxID=551994 RepID=A0A238XYI8_9PROT|nr:hypothetical protein [Methylobacillus rhizosphaerae]SNR63079.1 hypothetical protein SAMN05192560_0247 [Methylobacillus rhizosphaerae]
MSTNNQFYACSVCDPAGIKKIDLIGKFSIFMDKVLALSQADTSMVHLTEKAMIDTRVGLELALQGFISKKVHSDYHVECWRLLSEELANIAAYCQSMADGNKKPSKHFSDRQIDIAVDIITTGQSVNELPCDEREKFIATLREIANSDITPKEKHSLIGLEIKKAAAIVENTKFNPSSESEIPTYPPIEKY